MAEPRSTGRAAPRWDEAMRLARAAAPLMPAEELNLTDAVGRVLADDVRTTFPIPHYDSSAMDGYAVSGPPPWVLESAEAPAGIPTGAPAPIAVEPGHARPILTGGPVPPGATGIVRREYAEIARQPDSTSGSAPGESSVLQPNARCPGSELEPGRHIRRAGRESDAGELLAAAGTVLSPAHIAYAAVAGFDVLPVRRRPRISLIQTGDEVVAAGRPAPGMVRDAFGPQLPAYLAMLGAEVVSRTRIGDRAATTRAAFDAALAGRTPGGSDHHPADLVLTTGGTGHSSADHIRRVAEELTSAVIFPELDMRPGHPTMFSRLRGASTWHIGLPGNPLAAMVAMRVVVQPFLRASLGLEPEAPGTVVVPAGVPTARVDRLAPARRLATGPGWELCGAAGSNMLRGLAEADGLLAVPRDGIAPGGTALCLTLPWTDSTS